MSDNDNDIRAALKKADWSGEYDAGRDLTFHDMLAGSFRGQSRWMSVMAWIHIFAFTGLMVVGIVFFFQADTTRDQILWATVFLSSTVMVMMLKMWFWMAMNRNAVTREIKRLEMRIAELAERE
ncbi:hypothetical protein LCGC14_0019420 [marine sediment metagenome]|uniref:Transmembrane protein n=1 Tax=marine sediment metagenome TaxID=412755 RepID=A0A0F9W2E0_9ZZZZ